MTLLRGVVEPALEDVTARLQYAAMQWIGPLDPMDWPVVAPALAPDCPI